MQGKYRHELKYNYKPGEGDDAEDQQWEESEESYELFNSYISEGGSDLKYIDDNIDSVLKYMAVHNFIVNYDSLSGDGDHNFYLHEKDGKLSIVPWDYNLSLGAYEIES